MPVERKKDERLERAVAGTHGRWTALAAVVLGCLAAPACTSGSGGASCGAAGSPVIAPRVATTAVPGDADDPAIWLDPLDRSQSLILGTDKESNGALYAYDLQGGVVQVVTDLDRPNNVDVEYGLELASLTVATSVSVRGDLALASVERSAGSVTLDIAVVTERGANRLRVFSLPDLAPLDGGGIDVFVGEERRQPMGIALYRRPSDGAIFALGSRKSGPTDGYLWQYLLQDGGAGGVTGVKVRELGLWSGRGEIEAVAVDDELGYVYYADEPVGIRKVQADPDAPDAGVELALFGTQGFGADREGISLYTIDDGTGYVLVSDQACGRIQVFPRAGTLAGPHDHPLLATLEIEASASDGNEVTNAMLDPDFPAGLFVAMSNDRTFQLYSWPDLAGATLVVAPDGVPPGP